MDLFLVFLFWQSLWTARWDCVECFTFFLPSRKKNKTLFSSTSTRVKVFYFTIISIFGAKRFLLRCLCTALPRDYFSVDLCVTDIISCWFCFIFFKWQSFLCLFSHRYYHCSCCFFFYLSQTDPKHHFLYARGFFFFSPSRETNQVAFSWNCCRIITLDWHQRFINRNIFTFNVL